MKAFLVAFALVLLIVGSAFAGISSRLVVTEPAPTLMPWGMVGTAAAMGLSGLYIIFKRNK